MLTLTLIAGCGFLFPLMRRTPVRPSLAAHAPGLHVLCLDDGTSFEASEIVAELTCGLLQIAHLRIRHAHAVEESRSDEMPILNATDISLSSTY